MKKDINNWKNKERTKEIDWKKGNIQCTKKTVKYIQKIWQQSKKGIIHSKFDFNSQIQKFKLPQLILKLNIYIIIIQKKDIVSDKPG